MAYWIYFRLILNIVLSNLTLLITWWSRYILALLIKLYKSMLFYSPGVTCNNWIHLQCNLLLTLKSLMMTLWVFKVSRRLNRWMINLMFCLEKFLNWKNLLLILRSLLNHNNWHFIQLVVKDIWKHKKWVQWWIIKICI